MPALVPFRFLVRLAHPCLYVAKMPLEGGDDDAILDLPETAGLRNYAELHDGTTFADVRVAWNEFGLGVQATVKGKSEAVVGEADRPRAADGVTLWIDTRDARTSHRASRYCHQFHLLPTGGGPDKDEPAVVQTKINRAQQDAPLCDVSAIPFRCHTRKGGYILEAFLPAAALTGYDPEQHPRLGIYYQVHDQELGDQYLGVNAEFPFSDDPTLWDVLELKKG